MAIINITAQSNAVPGRIFEASYSSGSTQDWVILDSLLQGQQATVALLISSGQGYIEYCVESPSTIMGGAETGIQWSNGSVTTTSVSYFPSSTTAIRAVRSSGTIKLVISI